MTSHNNQTRAAVKQFAFAMLQQNKLSQAKELLEEICQSDKSDADARYMLGVVYGRLEQFDAAAVRFRQAIAIQPQMVMAHYGLGAALRAQGRLEEAATCFRRAVSLKPDLVEIHFELGTILQTLNKLDEARRHYQEAIRLRPSADAYYALGSLLSSQGLISDAIPNYREALKFSPDRADIHNALGFALYSTGNLNEAVDSYQHALQHKSDYPAVYDNLGKAFIMLGRIEEAVSCFQEALRIMPGYVHAASSIVTAYEWGGDYRKANEHLEPLIEQYPDEPAVAMCFTRLCKHVGRCREAVDLAEKALQQKNLPALDRRQLHFSVAKLYDSMNAYDQAFVHYQSANAILPPFYDPARHAREVDAVIATFTADLLRRLPRPSKISERPVFILGMPRSGTSLVEQILASHPSVFAAGELMDLSRVVTRMANLPGTRLGVHKLTKNDVDTLAQDYLGRLTALAPDADRITDKMPHNFLHLGIISFLFPKARVIHCMRDPLDTCLSIYFQYFSASHTYSYDLAHIGTHYREYERLMAHWRQVLDPPVLEVRYEDIVTNPEEMIRKLIDYCGLEWDPACLRFYENRRIVNTASYDQVRQPLHSGSIGRWKHYEQYLGPLKLALGIQ